MAARNLTVRNLMWPPETKNQTQPETVLFNFGLKVAYDVILKSRKSDMLFPEIEIVLIVIYAVLMTSGVVSNVLVCFVVMRQCAKKKIDLQKSRNLYIVNLAVADLALCCICTPFTLIGLIQRKWTFGSLLCKLIPVFQGTNITVSAGTITAIALDRYNTIVKSNSLNHINNGKCSRVVVIILLIWLGSLVLSFPLFFYTSTESVMLDGVVLYENCVEKWPFKSAHVIYALLFALVQFLIPVFVLTVIHLKISSYLKLHIKPLRKPKPEIHIHSPIEAIRVDLEKNSDVPSKKNGCAGEDDDPTRKVLLSIQRRESNISDFSSNRSCDSSLKLSDYSRKNSETSRKNSGDSSRNSCDLSPRKTSDFFLTFRENSDFYGFSFSRFSSKSRSSNKGQKRREIRRNRRTTFILSCIALIYAVSWLPMTAFQIVSALFPETGLSPGTSYLAYAFCHIFAMSSSITNPLFYGWLNTNFRREFSAIFSCPIHFYGKLMNHQTLHGGSRRK